MDGQCSSRHSETLAEEEESVGGPVVVVASVEIETVILLIWVGLCGSLSPGVERGNFREVAFAEIELRLEEDGGILREFVLETYSEPVPLSIVGAGSVSIVKEL